MSEKSPLYDEQGRIQNPEVAQEAAEIEKKYHKKTFGIFRASKGKISEGEIEAEFSIEHAREVKIEDIPDVVQKEMDQQILKMVKSNHQILSFESAYEGNIGGGVKRFRLFGKIEEGTVAMNIPITPSISVPVTFEKDVQFVIDVDGDIITHIEIKIDN